MRQLVFTDDLREMWHYSGLTMTEIAADLGVHKSDVSHALGTQWKKRRYGKLRKRIAKHLVRHYTAQYGQIFTWPPAQTNACPDCQDIYTVFKSTGYTQADIARMLGVNRSTVHRLLNSKYRGSEEMKNKFITLLHQLRLPVAKRV